jgi:mannose-6-phosphate isomerase-like protein (cupin superfamily)
MPLSPLVLSCMTVCQRIRYDPDPSRFEEKKKLVVWSYRSHAGRRRRQNCVCARRPLHLQGFRQGNESGYALLETTVVGEGPPPHIHKTEEEAFYVLENSFDVLVGEPSIKANAGAFVLVPRGTVHTFSKVGKPAKILIAISPAGLEKFFKEIAGPPNLEKYGLRLQSITSKS